MMLSILSTMSYFVGAYIIMAQRKRITEKTLKTKIYGNEPYWNSDNQPDYDSRNLHLAHAFHYFNQEFDKKKSWSFVCQWIMDHADTMQVDAHHATKAIEPVFHLYFVPTIFSLMRCETNGLVLNDDEITHIKNHLNDIIKKVAQSPSPSSQSEHSDDHEKKRISPIERIRNKVSEHIIPELEGFYDDLLKGGQASTTNSKTRKPSFSLAESLSGNDIKLINSAMATPITEWVNERIAFIDTLKTTSDNELLECYSNYTPTVTNRLRRELERLSTQVETVINTNKQKKKVERDAKKKEGMAGTGNGVKNPKTRKTNRKSQQDPSRLVSRFRYQKNDQEFSLESFNAEQIIGSCCVILYNTKYRTIHVVQASDGQTLSVKGMAITGFDESLSFAYRLRKPQDVLPFAVKKTRLQIIKYLKKQLTTKEQSTKGRTSDDTIILRVFNR